MTTKSKRPRTVIAIDPEDAKTLGEIAAQVGAPNMATMTRMGLRYVFKRIQAGELVNVNGTLVPADQVPQAA